MRALTKFKCESFMQKQHEIWHQKEILVFICFKKTPKQIKSLHECLSSSVFTAHTEYLAFAVGRTVQTLTLDGNETTIRQAFQPVTNLNGATALDFDAATNTIYFSQVAGKKISKVTGPSWNQVVDIVSKADGKWP